ncbi:MAG TPA: retroviral-like aspartic protease family protein [Pyrinomonadaceae bacterium]|nr:retroviral-like aspartic protease family protein [Pyrinomonadaceae bacterium]
MKGSLKSMAFVVASSLVFALGLQVWAVPLDGAAHLYAAERTGREARESVSEETSSSAQANASGSLPFAARFRLVEGRGLLVNAWINGAGPFRLAIDTGAGATLLSERVAQAARVSYSTGRRTTIGGLSGKTTGAGREAKLESLAIGDKNNFLPAQSSVVVTNSLPPDVDGLLDPTESYRPLGYTIDFPQGTISAFDPRTAPLRAGDASAGGAVVPWLFTGASRRPFVSIENGRRALIDTGSGLGLALGEAEAQAMGIIPRARGRRPSELSDLGGGRVSAHRIAPVTVRVGSMSLRNVPTDLLYGAEAGAPIILGRDALYPFKLSFDPLNRLIRIEPR